MFNLMFTVVSTESNSDVASVVTVVSRARMSRVIVRAVTLSATAAATFAARAACAPAPPAPAPAADLPALAARWAASPDESAPFVWCNRVAAGPHVVFVGSGARTRAAIAAARARDARTNVTVVLASGPSALASEAELNALGAAVFIGDVKQVDALNKLVLLGGVGEEDRLAYFDDMQILSEASCCS
jgi:hypothetical protein